MKRPDAKQIRSELHRRRLQEAQAMARSDAIQDARIAKAFDVLIESRDIDLRDFEAAAHGSVDR